MIDLFRSPQITVYANALVGPAFRYGDRVVDPKPGNYPEPDEVFLIYITQKTNHSWVAHHVATKKGANPDTTAGILYDSSKTKGDKSEYWVGGGLKGLIWKKSCYIYIVFDLDNHNFIDDETCEECDPIQFKEKKRIPGTKPSQYNYYDRNKSFYDGKVLTIRNRSAFRCINYLRDEFGDELKAPRVRSYGYAIRYEAPWEGEPKPHDIDPDGQNQGPPAKTIALSSTPQERRVRSSRRHKLAKVGSGRDGLRNRG